jgi:hypothetical protein
MLVPHRGREPCCQESAGFVTPLWDKVNIGLLP